MSAFTKEIDPLVSYGWKPFIIYTLCVKLISAQAKILIPKDIIKLLAKYYMRFERYTSSHPKFLLNGTAKTPQFIKIIGASLTGKTSLCKYLLASVVENNPTAAILLYSRTYEAGQRGVVSPLFVRICFRNEIELEAPNNIKHGINMWIVIEDSISADSVYEKCINCYKKGINIIAIAKSECKYLKSIKATTYTADGFSESKSVLDIPQGYIASKLMKKMIADASKLH